MFLGEELCSQNSMIIKILFVAMDLRGWLDFLLHSDEELIVVTMNVNAADRNLKSPLDLNWES